MAVVCSILASPAWATCIADPGYGVTCTSTGAVLLPKLSGKVFLAEIEKAVCSNKDEPGYNSIKLVEKVEGMDELAVTKSACIEALKGLSAQCSGETFAIRFNEAGIVSLIVKQTGGTRVCDM